MAQAHSHPRNPAYFAYLVPVTRRKQRVTLRSVPFSIVPDRLVGARSQRVCRLHVSVRAGQCVSRAGGERVCEKCFQSVLFVLVILFFDVHLELPLLLYLKGHFLVSI